MNVNLIKKSRDLQLMPYIKWLSSRSFRTLLVSMKCKMYEDMLCCCHRMTIGSEAVGTTDSSLPATDSYGHKSRSTATAALLSDV
jgi:hypothetical protein